MILKPRAQLASFFQLKPLDRSVKVQKCLGWKKCQSAWKISSRSIHATSVLKIPGTSNLKLTESVRPIIDDRNVFRSRHGDVEIPDDYMHQLVWRNVDKFWDLTAVVCARTGKSHTYGELRKLSGRFATSLRKNRVLPGTMLAVVLPNVPEYAIIVLGASEAGVQVTLVNPSYTAYEIKQQLDNSEAKAVITNSMTHSRVIESMKLGANRIPVIVIPDGNDLPADTVKFEDLIADGIEEFEKTGEKSTVNTVTDTAVLPFSSGTTGLPKGVELTHRNLVAGICLAQHPHYAIIGSTLDGPQETVPLFLPMFHIYGLQFCLLYSLSIGTKLVFMPQFTSNNFVDVLEKYQVTSIIAVPPVIQLLTNDDNFTKKHFTHLRAVGSGAAPLAAELITRLRLKIGDHFDFIQGYGLTESSSLTTTGRNCPLESAGFITTNTQIRVVAPGENGGKNLGVDEIGEFYIKGPQVMKGYFKNPEATRDCMDGEWLKSGDLGYIDSRGQLFLTGRLKELIKVQGSQVAPVELENIILCHEKVADAAVVGVPHEKYGEVPKAFVVPKRGVTITEEEIKDFVAERVVKYKRIGHVVFTDKIVKSASGKILRRELQQM